MMRAMASQSWSIVRAAIFAGLQGRGDQKAQAREQFAKASEKANSPEAQAARQLATEQTKKCGKDFDNGR